jgi:hypothetical protein
MPCNGRCSEFGAGCRYLVPALTVAVVLVAMSEVTTLMLRTLECGYVTTSTTYSTETTTGYWQTRHVRT